MSELNRLSTEEFRQAPKLPVVIVLDDVRSAYNVGAVFRSADAFRVEAIHICGISATPPHKDIRKTALGATESVEWKYFDSVEDSLQSLRKMDYRIFAVEQAEPRTLLPDWKIPPDKKIALVFGHEVNGISDKALSYADECIEIPQYGTKHSLNISVSAGIILWEVVKSMEHRA